MCDHLQKLFERRFLCARNEQMNLQDIDYVLVWLEKYVFLSMFCLVFDA